MTPSEPLRALMTADDRLGDIARARVWGQLEDRLGAPARPRSRALVFAAFAAGAAAAAVVAVVLAVRGGGVPAERLVVPAASTLTTTIGHARVALVGPARMDVGETLRLDRGTLVVDFAGGEGRRMRVTAPGMTVEVVGTLFAVEVSATTCVSVAHGRVKAILPEETILVDGGQRACSDGSAPPIAPSTRELLDRHAVATGTGTGTAPAAAAAAVPAAATAAAAVPAAAATAAAAAAAAAAAVAVTEAEAEAEAEAETETVTVTEAETETVTVTEAETESEAVPATVAVPDAAPATPPESTPSDVALYEAAEAALARGDTKTADAALATLLIDHPGSALVDQALYERARLAYARRAWTAARGYLDRLAGYPSSALAEPGRYLGCRIAVEAGDADAARCLADYRSTYPRSPHDLEVLGLLAKLAHADGGCAAALTYVDELATIYGRTDLARAWRDRCPAP
jgi:hypothetical protein